MGDLDTSTVIPWLKENYGCDVLALVANVGRSEEPGEELSRIQENLLKAGASKVFIEDLRADFVTQYLWPLVKSGATYEGSYLLGTAIARPMIAKRQVEIALREGADALVHACTTNGNDRTRFDLAYRTLAPQLSVLAPPYAAPAEKPYSRDSNLWHMSHEGGILEDPAEAVPRDMYELTLDAGVCPDGESEITIDFRSGVPVGLNGTPIPPVQMIDDLNEIAGTNGIGRVDIVENSIDGTKLRSVYETPGGTLIMAAHRELESLILDRQTRHQKDILAITYAQLVYDGLWFTPRREELDAFFGKINEKLNGSVTMSLYKGTLAIRSRRSSI